MKSPDWPPADQVEDAFSGVAVKSPASPLGPAVSAKVVTAADVRLTVAVTVPAEWWLTDGTGVGLQAAASGVVSAPAGTIASRSRDA